MQFKHFSFHSKIVNFREAVFLMQEEVKDPAKTLTRAIWLGMSSVVVVYLMVNISYFTVLTPQELLDSGAVAVVSSI